MTALQGKFLDRYLQVHAGKAKDADAAGAGGSGVQLSSGPV